MIILKKTCWLIFYFSSPLSVCAYIHQPVHVGAAGEHQETLHLLVGGFHHLLRPAIQTNGLYDRWERRTHTQTKPLYPSYILYTPHWPLKECKYLDSIRRTQTNAFIQHLCNGSPSPCAAAGYWHAYLMILVTAISGKQSDSKVLWAYILERCLEQK